MKCKIFSAFSIILLMSMGLLFKGMIQPAQLVIQVSNIKKTQGFIVVSIFNNKKDYLIDEKAYRKVRIPVDQQALSCVFTNLPQGHYSVALYHDVNGDGVCNRNLFGIPKEPYAFSNNKKPIISAPSFEETHFKFKHTQHIEVRLIQPK